MSKVSMSFESRYAHQIQKNIYECSVPDEATMSPGYIKHFGVHSTGFRDADKQLSNRRARVYLNILTMLDYYNKGIDIMIINESDIKDIHTLIINYLEEWRYHIRTSVNVRVTEYEDLLKDLTDFASALFNLITTTDIKKEEQKEKQPTVAFRPITMVLDEKESFERPTFEDKYGDMFDVINKRMEEEY